MGTDSPAARKNGPKEGAGRTRAMGGWIGDGDKQAEQGKPPRQGEDGMGWDGQDSNGSDLDSDLDWLTMGETHHSHTQNHQGSGTVVNSVGSKAASTDRQDSLTDQARRNYANGVGMEDPEARDGRREVRIKHQPQDRDATRDSIAPSLIEG